jgi:cytochrome c-type biogenesis protein CcmH/NrfF
MAQAATDKATATIKSLQATNEALKAEQAEQTEKLNQLFGIVNTNNKVEASNTALANATAAHIPQTLESGESKENNNMDIT